MMPKKPRKISTVKLRVLEQEGDKELDCGNVFGQILTLILLMWRIW
jgi:hypothetical protein